MLCQHQGHSRPHQEKGFRRTRDRETSSAIHHPKPQPPRPNTRTSPTRIDPNALLHPTNTDSEPMYRRWEGEGCIAGFQDDEVQLPSERLGRFDTGCQESKLVVGDLWEVDGNMKEAVVQHIEAAQHSSSPRLRIPRIWMTYPRIDGPELQDDRMYNMEDGFTRYGGDKQ